MEPLSQPRKKRGDSRSSKNPDTFNQFITSKYDDTGAALFLASILWWKLGHHEALEITFFPVSFLLFLMSYVAV